MNMGILYQKWARVKGLLKATAPGVGGVGMLGTARVVGVWEEDRPFFLTGLVGRG